MKALITDNYAYKFETYLILGYLIKFIIYNIKTYGEIIMNYLQLINKILVEMNYKTVSSFQELVKQDHIKIKQLLSRVNNDICASCDWNFLLREDIITVQEGKREIENPIFGRIDSLIIEGIRWKFDPDWRKFLLNQQKALTFSFFNNKILIGEFETSKTALVSYYTNNAVVDVDGNEKQEFENETDQSLIPMPFAEPVLIYGTCLKFKGNPSHVKFKYWYSMYNDSLANLRSNGDASAFDKPFISI